MYVGRYYHQLENAGRLSLPKAFRDQSATWVVTRGLDGSLFVFGKDEFAETIAKSSTRSLTSKTQRHFWRLLANDAVEVQPDKLGRIQLPEYLLAAAGLTKQVVITGSVEYIEIWDMDRYHSFRENLDPQAEDIAEELDKGSV
jgi:MraZ protein